MDDYLHKETIVFTAKSKGFQLEFLLYCNI